MKKTHTICIRVDPIMADGLKLRSLVDNISVGELCRNLITKGIKYENNEHQEKNRQKDF